MTEPRIPITVITGFLGSGKTTLINRLLPLPEMAGTAVLVNEFGQIAIDDDLIAGRGDGVVEMTNGCVCCALNEDLAPTLLDLRDQRPGLAKVVIETTGLANAGPIVQVILGDPDVRQAFTLDQVVTTVDAVHGSSNLNIHAESVEQVAVADRLVITKRDALDPARDPALTDLRARLRDLNPAATTVDADTADLAGLITAGANLARDTDPGTYRPAGCHDDHDHAHHDHHDPGHHDQDHAIGPDTPRHDHNIGTFCVVRDQPIDLDALRRFWTALAETAGPNLLRVKGIINVADHPETPAVLQGVQDVFENLTWLDTWPSDDRRSRIVFIGWMLDQARIESLLDAAET